MNSKAHDLCEEWIVNKFKGFGLEVETQKADLTGWDGTKLHSTNIIAHFNPQAQRRILICAHWDSRPWADNDPDSANWHKPVLAANDGASGVGVMLELARILQNDTTLAIGVDLVCFDAEDYGTPQWAEQRENSESTWALGAQYWAKNLPENYEPQFGILLDMVGGQGAKFYQEQFSLRYAASIVDKVWSAARHAGFSSLFTNEVGGGITDDHIPVNEAGIPTVDVIPFYPDCDQSSFGPTWHTVNDDMEHLDINTLKAVGQTLIQVIYSE
jgi:Zn-dependent M28 family amino/carboxypeptidase